MHFDWFLLWLGLRVAVQATLIAAPIGVGLAWMLARREGRLGTAVSWPLALPPGVLTYYVLVQTGRFSSLIFTWRWAVVAAVIYATPLLFASSRAAFEGLDPACERAARSLGASRWRVFWRVTLPLARKSILTAMALVFARALVDVGLTLILAGGVAR